MYSIIHVNSNQNCAKIIVLINFYEKRKETANLTLICDNFISRLSTTKAIKIIINISRTTQ